MARKPKTQPSPDDAVPVPEPAAPDEAAAPARRGRKAGAAALSFASPAAASAGDPATDDAGTDVPPVAATKAPGRRGPGRKPKQAASAETAPAVPDLIEDEAPAAAVSQADAAADSDPVQPGRDPTSPVSETAQRFPEAEAPVPAKPAVHWDRATDTVEFDWPAIERAAAQDGVNQGMAKLLVAARAEGAQSRWPF